MIPNFCLDSQPSGIPLILHGLPFSFQHIKAPYIVFHYFYFFLIHALPFSNFLILFFYYLLFLFFLSLSFFSSPSSFFYFYFYFYFFIFCKYGYNCPLAPTFLDVLGFEAYIELLGRLMETDIQWVVEWWHISSMVHNCCKDHCVTLVGL